MINFLQFLRKKYAEKIGSPIRKGTVTDELHNKPVALLMSDFYNILVEEQKINNIGNYANMTEDQMNAFGNKFFWPRIQGGKAVVNVTVWVQNPVTVQITEGFRAAADDGLLYLAIQPRTITGDSMTQTNDEFGKYTFTVLCIAEFEGVSYNKLEGDISTLNGVDFAFTHVTNPLDAVAGAAHETNTTYYPRLRYGINDRSLMNNRSVYAGLRDRFPYVYSVYNAGPGNKYMQRDRLQAVDLSLPSKKADYLGKIQGDNIVKNSAYYDIFPPAAGTRGASYAGPFSTYSVYDIPQTIEAVDLTSTDPAYHGYPLYQEATNEMYRGLYYDDFRNFMEVTTEDLFNIEDEPTVTTTKIIPDESWVVGAHGKSNGDYGLDKDSGLDKVDIVQFETVNITLRGGVGFPVTASKDIEKRTGIKMEGVFSVAADSSTAYNSSFQFMVGGANTIDAELKSVVDAFSGIGFGIRMFRDINLSNTDETNCSIYFANNERYGAAHVFATTSDVTFGHTSALQELPSRIVPGNDYAFEFVIYDDLTLALKITPEAIAAPTTENDTFNEGSSWILPSTYLDVFKSKINSLDTDSYGSMIKVTVDSESMSNADEWTVSGFRAVDLAVKKATSLYVFNVDGLEEPLEANFRGSGSGSVNGINQAGHSVYIWNVEQIGDVSGNTVLSAGGWQRLDDVSDVEGLKDVVTTSLSQRLQNIDRYVVSSRFGNVMIFMVATTGSSEAKLAVNGETQDDIQSTLTVDYLNIQDQQIDTYRGNNKVDVYVNTTRNSDVFRTVEVQLTKASTAQYFTLNIANGIEMPLVEILTILDGNGNVLGVDEYTISRNSDLYINSTQDEIFITTEATDITLTYSVYNRIETIQAYYDGDEYGKVFGNVLVKHKFPVYLDLELFYSGDTEEDTMIDTVRNFVDDNFTTIFDNQALVNYLFTNGFASNITQPLVVTYEKFNDEFLVDTGTFTDRLYVRDIDFFRIRNISVSRI